jgi:DNA-binding LytR/AlgR family response regulator
MRVLIVDDEPAARSRLAMMLEELDVEVVGTAGNGLAALEAAARLRPDVLLLDVAMPEIDGIDVARMLPDPKPLIIFQTAYDDYAVSAFEHAAIDYLLKPVGLERLRASLDRAATRLGAPSYESLRQVIVPPIAPRVLVRDRGGHCLLGWDEVVRFATEGGAVFAVTGDRRYLTDFTLAELEARAAVPYLRVSRSELVRADAVRRIAQEADGGAELELVNGDRVRASRRRWPEVRAALGA